MVAMIGNPAGDNHVKEHLHIVCPFELGRFGERFGYPRKKVSHEENIPRIYRKGNNDGPLRIHEMQIVYDEVIGNRPARKQHGDNDKYRKELFELQLFSRKAVSVQRGGKHHSARRENGHKYRIEKRTYEDVRREKDIRIRRPRKFADNQAVAVFRKRPRRSEGGAYDQQDRHYENHREHNHQYDIGGVENPFRFLT